MNACKGDALVFNMLLRLYKKELPPKMGFRETLYCPQKVEVPTKIEWVSRCPRPNFQRGPLEARAKTLDRLFSARSWLIWWPVTAWTCVQPTNIMVPAVNCSTYPSFHPPFASSSGHTSPSFWIWYVLQLGDSGHRLLIREDISLDPFTETVCGSGVRSKDERVGSLF